MANERMTINRRKFGVTAGAAVAAAALPTGFSAAAAETATLTICSYGGSYQEAQDKAMFTPFHQANPNVMIKQDSPSTPAKVQAMVEAGQVTWDIVNFADDFGLDSDAKWFEPIDYSIIDRNQFVDGYANTYRVGADIEATVIAYRKDRLKDAPRNFADFFDLQKFPGKRTIWKYAPGGVFEAALLADGVSPDKLYPIDVPRALRKLDTIKSSIVWWDTGAQSVQFLTSGEVNLGFVWCGRAGAAGETAPIGISWGQWTTQNGWWTVPKGSPNKRLAMEAIKFFTSAQATADLTKYLPYGPTNKGGAGNINPRFKGNLPHEHFDTRVAIDFAWWNQNLPKVDPQFQDWLLT